MKKIVLAIIILNILSSTISSLFADIDSELLNMRTFPEDYKFKILILNEYIDDENISLYDNY